MTEQLMILFFVLTALGWILFVLRNILRSVFGLLRDVVGTGNLAGQILPNFAYFLLWLMLFSITAF